MLEEKSIPWRELIEIAFRRRRILAYGLLAGLALGAVWAFSRAPVYRARATLQLTAQAPLSSSRAEPLGDKELEAELTLLKSAGLLRTVLEEFPAPEARDASELGIADRTRSLLGSAVKAPLRLLRGASAAPALDRQIQALAERLDVQRVGRSNVIEVGLISENPSWAAQFINQLVENHLERIAELGGRLGASSFFEKQADLLAKQWKRASEDLRVFKEEHGASLGEGDAAELRQILSNLEAERVATETQQLELQAKIDYLGREIEIYPQTIESESRVVAESESVKFLKSRLLELEFQRSELLSRFTPTSTLVRDIDRQIQEAERLLAAKEGETLEETTRAVNPSYQALEVDKLQTEAALIAARARLQALNSQIETYKVKVGRLEGLSSELERLQSEVDNAWEAHQAYLKQMETARLESALDQSGIVNVSIVEPAEVPLSPLPSGNLLRIALGAALGLLLGAAIAFARDWLDPTLKSSTQIQRATGLRVVAEIPQERPRGAREEDAA